MCLFIFVLIVFQVFSLLHGECHEHIFTTIATKDWVHGYPMLVMSKQLRCIIDSIT